MHQLSSQPNLWEAAESTRAYDRPLGNSSAQHLAGGNNADCSGPSLDGGLPNPHPTALTSLWRLLRLLPLVAVTFLLQNLQAAHFFGGHLGPGHAEVCHIKFQFQHALE